MGFAACVERFAAGVGTGSAAVAERAAEAARRERRVSISIWPSEVWRGGRAWGVQKVRITCWIWNGRRLRMGSPFVEDERRTFCEAS